MLIAFGQQIALGNLGIITITQKKLHSQKETIEMGLSSASECGHFAMSKSMFVVKHSSASIISIMYHISQ